MILSSFFISQAILYYLSHAVIIQSSMNGIINSWFTIILLMFISALILARAYCG
jgi:hypothetical protein